MDELTLRELGERLAREIAGEPRARVDKRQRCPGELRSSVVSFARVCREHGEPIRDIAQRLGLVESTLARWLRAERRQGRAGFRSVAIVPSHGTAPEHVALPLRLLTPRGYSVEGLDPQTLAFLLKVVG